MARLTFTVLHYDSMGNLLARPGKQLPRLGSIVLDGKGKRVGRVTDIIGSTKSPYLVIKTSRKDKIGTVYIGGEKKK